MNEKLSKVRNEIRSKTKNFFPLIFCNNGNLTLGDCSLKQSRICFVYTASGFRQREQMVGTLFW